MNNINSDSYMTQGQMKCHPPNFILVGGSNNLANLFREQTNNKSNPTKKNHQPLLNFVTGSPDIIIWQAENTIEPYKAYKKYKRLGIYCHFQIFKFAHFQIVLRSKKYLYEHIIYGTSKITMLIYSKFICVAA